MKKQHPFYEILAKEIAYVFDEPKFENPVDEFFHPQGYILDQSFDKPNTGLRAFGLLPITAQKTPILVFRGSSKAIDDISNDYPKGIEYRTHLTSKKRLQVS